MEKMTAKQLLEQTTHLSEDACAIAQAEAYMYFRKNELAKKTVALKSQAIGKEPDGDKIIPAMNKSLEMLTNALGIIVKLAKSQYDKNGQERLSKRYSRFFGQQEKWAAQKNYGLGRIGSYLDSYKDNLNAVKYVISKHASQYTLGEEGQEAQGISIEGQLAEIGLLYLTEYENMVLCMEKRDMENAFTQQKEAIEAMISKMGEWEDMMCKICDMLEAAVAG